MLAAVVLGVEQAGLGGHLDEGTALGLTIQPLEGHATGAGRVVLVAIASDPQVEATIGVVVEEQATTTALETIHAECRRDLFEGAIAVVAVELVGKPIGVGNEEVYVSVIVEIRRCGTAAKAAIVSPLVGFEAAAVTSFDKRDVRRSRERPAHGWHQERDQ